MTTENGQFMMTAADTGCLSDVNRNTLEQHSYDDEQVTMVKPSDECTTLTCRARGVLEELWKHLVVLTSCITEPNSDWLNPHSHPGKERDENQDSFCV